MNFHRGEKSARKAACRLLSGSPTLFPIWQVVTGPNRVVRQGPANVKPSETQRMFSMQNRSAEVHLNATDDDPGTASQHIFLMDCQEGVSIDCNFVQQMGAEQLLTRNCPFFLKLNTDADSCSVLHMGPK
jgi:hypothetical protein